MSNSFIKIIKEIKCPICKWEFKSGIKAINQTHDYLTKHCNCLENNGLHISYEDEYIVFYYEKYKTGFYLVHDGPVLGKIWCSQKQNDFGFHKELDYNFSNSEIAFEVNQYFKNMHGYVNNLIFK
jgi:hypothetical protein